MGVREKIETIVASEIILGCVKRSQCRDLKRISTCIMMKFARE
jgi:hypothetical protein